MNSVKIDILGNSFSIQTDEDPAYMRQLLALVDKRIALVRAQTRSQDPVMLAVLAALMLADEGQKVQAKLAAQGSERDADTMMDSAEAADIAARLISAIDDRLPG